MEFNWWTFGFQIVNLLVLLELLRRFLFKPIANIIAERAEEARQALEEAEQAKKEADQAKRAAEKEFEELDLQRPKLIQIAKEEARLQQEELVHEAREQAARIISEANVKASRMIDSSRKKQSLESIKLALRIARRAIGNIPLENPLPGYAARLVEAIRNLEPARFSALLDDARSVTLVSPWDIPDKDIRAVRKAVSECLGKDIEIEVRKDPDLVAGLELETRHGVIHNSLKSDMESISRSVLSDDTEG